MRDRHALDIVAFGEPLVEFVRAEHPEIGPYYRLGFGGDTSNAAIAAARQGAKVGYITALGTDEFGDELMALYKRESVDTSAIIKKENAATGVYFVRPHASGRQFSYLRNHSAASQFGTVDLNPSYIADARILHVSAISQAISASMCGAVVAAIKIARQHETLVSYDTNLRLKLWTLDEARNTIFAAMPMVDIVFPSDDEAKLLTGLTEPDEIADFFLGLGPRIVVLKQGAEGALVATPERREAIPPVSVVAVDSTGAGDAVAGSFLAHYCETDDPFVAARRAAQVAATTVTGLGAVAPIPHRYEIKL